jgi:alpha-glucosidase
MSPTFTFIHTCILLWTSLLQLGGAVSLKRADSCSGYKASNVQRSDSSLTADLTLAGTACNIYGEDLKDLKFLAQWQTGMSRISTLHL